MTLFESIGLFFVILAATIGTSFIVGAFICGAMQICSWIQSGRKWGPIENSVQQEVRRK